MAIDFGTDTQASSDLTRRETLVTGKINVGYALARRFMTPRGGLAAIGGDPDYGLDLREMVNSALTLAQQARWKADIALEAEKDPRIQNASADFVFDQSRSTATVTITLVSADDGAPFTLVLQVTAATVEVLEVK